LYGLKIDSPSNINAVKSGVIIYKIIANGFQHTKVERVVGILY